MIWRRGNSKAFTLIELVVVIAIIAILSMIVTASTIAVLRNTQRKSMETTLSNYWRLTETYFDQINKGMSASGAPQREALGTRLNMRYSYIILKTTP
ncbi:MAG: prepilin-type N-terminal cleavage/methylation domain-containing protein, partial [Clostridia bacterium]|nr:prepilin-type N-terminal cleavage/methylation domain-containing protein [Clostridia bacterium]